MKPQMSSDRHGSTRASVPRTRTLSDMEDRNVIGSARKAYPILWTAAFAVIVVGLLILNEWLGGV